MVKSLTVRADALTLAEILALERAAFVARQHEQAVERQRDRIRIHREQVALDALSRSARTALTRNRTRYSQVSARPKFCGCDVREPCEHDLPKMLKIVNGFKPVDLSKIVNQYDVGQFRPTTCETCYLVHPVTAVCDR